MQLNKDRTRASLEINTELDATGVESLIRALALLRAQMEPGVPVRPPDGTATMTQDSPALVMDYPAADGSVTLRLRNLGLGWISWRLPAADVDALRASLDGFNRHPAAVQATGHKH